MELTNAGAIAPGIAESLDAEIDELCYRLDRIETSLTQPNVSIAKELRQFNVEVHPEIRFLLRGAEYQIRTGRSYQLPQITDSLLNRLGFMTRLPVGRGDFTVPLKLSRRTILRDHDSVEKVVQDGTRRARLRLGRVPRWVEVLEDLGKDVGYLQTDVRDDELLREALGVYLHSDDTTILERGEYLKFSEKYHVEPDLELKTRFYVNRCDMRAYYRDGNLIRQMAGSMFLRLIIPKNQTERERTEYSRYYPTHGRDEIDEIFELADGERLGFLFGDISSFSSSNPEAHAVALALCARAQMMKDEEPEVIFDIGTEYISAKPSEITRAYIHETLWARAKISDTQNFVPVGGCLGVACNMPLNILSFIWTLRLICAQFDDHYRIVFKLGGDDFWLALITHDGTDPTIPISEIGKLIRRYIGQLKEPKVFEPRRSVPTDLRYCQKRVIIEWKGRTCYVYTIPTPPVPATLFGKVVGKPSDVSTGYFQLCSRYTNSISLPEMLDVYMRLFRRLYPDYPEPSSGSTLRCYNPDQFLVSEKRVMTVQAYNVVKSTHCVAGPNWEILRGSVGSRIRYQTAKDVLTTVRLRDRADEMWKLCCMKSEMKRFLPVHTFGYRVRSLYYRVEEILEHLERMSESVRPWL